MKPASPVEDGQRLPVELILLILDYQIQDQPWTQRNFLLLNKEIRCALLHRAYQHIHLYQPIQSEQLVKKGWPGYRGRISMLDRKHDDVASLSRSIYLHSRYDLVSMTALLNQLQSLTSWERNRVTTFAYRPSYWSDEGQQYLSLWACKVFPKLKELYIDLSGPESVLKGRNAQVLRATNSLTKMSVASTELEALAFVPEAAGRCSLALDQPEVARILGTHFPKLKRLYLFSCFPKSYHPEIQDERELNQVETVEVNIGHQLELLVAVTIHAKPPWYDQYPRESAFVYKAGNYTKINSLEVEWTGDQDILSLMHRVIDDVNAIWAPEAFQGYQWDPSTRPSYLRAVPTEDDLRRIMGRFGKQRS